MAVGSLVLGIVGIVFSFIISIIPIINNIILIHCDVDNPIKKSKK